MKNIKVYICVLVSLFNLLDIQAQVETEIQSESIYELSVIQVFPDLFPEVEVIFQARNQTGQPLWGISEDDLVVFENEKLCEVLELTNLGEEDIIDIALVFDHSGSMGLPAIPNSTYYTLSNQEYDSLMLLPKPIDFAKEGVLSFIKSSELASDSILIIGFSSEVDEILGPTQDTDLLESKVSDMQADFGTAFYDALIETIERLSLKEDQKMAMVALTDGQDNESRNSINDVVEKANDAEVPIYVIGLGNVQDSILQLIADETGGLYYKTDDPNRLEEIYLSISRQIKSIYKLKYKSEIEGFAQGDQSLRFDFLNDTLSFSNPDIRLTLPYEVVRYINEQEDVRQNNIKTSLIIGGTSAGMTILGLTTFMLYRRNRKKKFRIARAYPNPFSNRVTIDIESNRQFDNVRLEIVSLSGVVVQSELAKMNGISVKIITTRLPVGIYLIRAGGSDGLSDTIKAVKK